MIHSNQLNQPLITAMQPSFFDRQERFELLEQQGDPLPSLERTVDQEAFRAVTGLNL